MYMPHLYPTHQVLYPLQFLAIGQHEGAVVPKQVQQVWRLWDIETDVVPVVEILISVLLCEGDGRELVPLLHEILVGQVIESSLLVRFDGFLGKETEWSNRGGGINEGQRLREKGGELASEQVTERVKKGGKACVGEIWVKYDEALEVLHPT